MAPWQTSTPPRRQRARPYRPRGQRLAPLFEESPSPPRRPRKSSAHYRSALDETLFGDGDASDDDIPRLFQWEDEKTLVSDLMHHSTARHDPNDARYAETLEQLHQLFRDQDYALVDDMAKALFPAVDTVKRCHAHAKEEIDETFARGMTEFNDACKSVEAVTVEDLKLLPSLFEQLDAAYAKRKQLWKDFKQDFNVICWFLLLLALLTSLTGLVGAAEDQLKTLPAQFERTCAALDKESKKLSKTDGQAEKLTALLKKL
uniref:Uncharacterized protein n=1 Tax=Schizophyllum commune (strain H4-8 / FGSC 9210) TaxID=578458 RepID=D8PSU3_SCHCM